jgi:hypothetical protein
MVPRTRRRHDDTEGSDDETSHVGSMSHLSGDEENESVMDYPDDGSSVVDAMSQASGGVAASTVDETKTTDSVTAAETTAAETKVGEETGETPTKKSVDP